jgi:hypothetical protein
MGNAEKHMNNIWRFLKSWGTPKSSILVGMSIINHPFWGPPFQDTSIYIIIYMNTYENMMDLGASTPSKLHTLKQPVVVTTSQSSHTPGAQETPSSAGTS